MGQRATLWTIGHGSADVDDLFRLLEQQQIEVLADVRSSPYSRYAPQANREAIAAVANRRGVRYVFLGDELGGQPADRAMYTRDDEPDYRKIEASELFRRGIETLTGLAGEHRVCFMCAEEDPARCHRSLLVGESLVRQGHEVRHIRHDGKIETQAEMKLRRDGGQLWLFEVA